MQTAQVIPFHFEAHEVRATVIDGEPWFIAADACKVLGIINTTQALQALDKDERSMFNIGRQGSANIVNESGLYTLILRSRDATKPGTPQHRFRKWVTAEVLPTIRRTGRYHDTHNRMPTLIDELIGLTELNVIKELIRDKAKAVPAEKQYSFALTMHSRLHTRFNVPRTELIPAERFADACNFIAAYALEGEWLPRNEVLDASARVSWSNISYLLNCVEQCYAIFEHYHLYTHLRGLGCPAGAELMGHLWDAQGSVRHVRKHCAEQLAQV